MTRRGVSRWLIGLAGWLGLAATTLAQSNHVVIISIDGLRPEFYLAGALSASCETLVELRDAGSHAKGVMPPYPSVTYPGHTTIVTGVNPARHGITGNSVFEPPKTDGRGFWFASDVRAPTLWDAAKAAGLTVGAVSWPCTAGSTSIDWDVPEFWTSPLGRDLDVMRKYSPTGLVDAIEARIGPATAERRKDGAQWDAFLAGSAAHIIREHKPNLMLVHFIEADKAQHQGGRAGTKLPAVLRRIDGHVYDLVEATKKAGIDERTTFLVLGDHGFADVKKSIAPNWLLAREGFITLAGERVVDWKAMVENTGGSAGVYLKDPTDAATTMRLRMLLERSAVTAAGKRLYRLIDKERLTKLGGPRGAAFYLEAEPGYMFSSAHNGDGLVRPAPIKGNHGFLPTNPDMRTGFIAAGRGVKKGVTLDSMRLADVAPTVARLLGLRLADTDGRALDEILEVP
jgi:predicted AlkP superfamily pyrophosphatase or phosphodiesterase